MAPRSLPYTLLARAKPVIWRGDAAAESSQRTNHQRSAFMEGRIILQNV
jgi:hypothetical protein